MPRRSCKAWRRHANARSSWPARGAEPPALPDRFYCAGDSQPVRVSPEGADVRGLPNLSQLSRTAMMMTHHSFCRSESTSQHSGQLSPRYEPSPQSSASRANGSARYIFTLPACAFGPSDGTPGLPSALQDYGHCWMKDCVLRTSPRSSVCRGMPCSVRFIAFNERPARRTRRHLSNPVKWLP